MEESPPLPAVSDAPPPRRYGEEFLQIAERFREVGALGLVLVGGSALAEVERFYGAGAHRRVTGSVAALLWEATEAHRAPGDLLVTGEEGSDEVILLLFRPRSDATFYRDVLPILADQLGQQLAKNGSRVLYPYHPGNPHFSVGTAVALHSAVLGEGRQLSVALADARDDGELRARIETRERRRRFVELVLAEDVSTLYEPIVNLATREIFGYEALVRGPMGSPVQTPGAFFQLAEETDLMFEVDCLCRRSALRNARGLPPGKKLFLNCRPTAIRDPSFHGDALRRSLEALQLQPTDVVFEISEKESIENFAIFREARDHFASLGFGVALDDMGVGYSSLEAVMELLPDFIKVDQSLVRSIDTDPPRQELLRALNGLAQKLEAGLVAEGIETSEELATLQALGVPFGQGYLLGRPAPMRRSR